MTFKKKYLLELFAHVVLWIAFYGLVLYPFITRSIPLSPSSLFKLSLTTLLFYINYFFLVPKLLLKKNIRIYVLVSFLLIISIGLISQKVLPPDFPERFRNPRPFVENLFMFRPFSMYLVTFGIPYIVSAVLRIYVEWKKNEDLKKVVEKEKVESELQLLKTQLNPHFLFNSLNTIYALSVKNSRDTPKAVVNLSELMRYMLYEADKDMVPLTKELDYVQSYVQLQRLRMPDSRNVNLNISGEDWNKAIPPLLFISFIENAFKYGTDYEGKTYIKINLWIKKGSIQLHVVNKIGGFKEPSKNSGLGLENVKNRLKLLYPNSHELVVKNDGKTYSVDLTLKL